MPKLQSWLVSKNITSKALKEAFKFEATLHFLQFDFKTDTTQKLT